MWRFFSLHQAFLATCLSPEAAACPLAGGSPVSSAAKALSLTNAQTQLFPRGKGQLWKARVPRSSSHTLQPSGLNQNLNGLYQHNPSPEGLAVLQSSIVTGSSELEATIDAHPVQPPSTPVTRRVSSYKDILLALRRWSGCPGAGQVTAWVGNATTAPPKPRPSSVLELVTHQTAKSITSLGRNPRWLTALLHPKSRRKKPNIHLKRQGGCT